MKNLKYFILFICIAAMIASCQKDKLNPSSQTYISAQDASTTAARLQSQVNGLYTALKSGSFMGGRYNIFSDVRGENFINETGNGVTALTVWNFTVTGSDTYVNNMWNAAYNTINQVNIFLSVLNGNTAVSDSAAKQYKGEAEFVRAVAYYSIMQLFAPPYTTSSTQLAIPLRLTPITNSGSSNLARSTVADVYAQILADLNDAETLLPLTYGNATTNTIHAHRNSAIAFKTRVYLSMGDYANVITEANKIVPASAPFTAATGVANALQSDVTKVFASPYTTTESIFSLPFSGVSEAPGTQNQMGYYFLPASAGDGDFSLNASGIIGDATWKATDARRNLIKTSSGKQWMAKYTAGSPYADWVPVLRYAEVLLNLAEARTKSTNSVDAQAIALLNAVRNRSDPSTTFTAASFATSTDLVNAILKERNIEFLGEGMRSSDIMRLGLSFPAKGSVKAIAPTDFDYVLQAPTSETQYNALW